MSSRLLLNDELRTPYVLLDGTNTLLQMVSRKNLKEESCGKSPATVLTSTRQVVQNHVNK